MQEYAQAPITTQNDPRFASKMEPIPNPVPCMHDETEGTEIILDAVIIAGRNSLRKSLGAKATPEFLENFTSGQELLRKQRPAEFTKYALDAYSHGYRSFSALR